MLSFSSYVLTIAVFPLSLLFSFVPLACASNCTDNFTVTISSNLQYGYINYPTHFWHAREICDTCFSQDLASIHSEADNLEAFSACQSRDCWIGGINVFIWNNGLEWIDGSGSINTSLTPNPLDVTTITYGCAKYSGSLDWIVRDCTSLAYLKAPFLCNMPTAAPTNAPTLDPTVQPTAPTSSPTRSPTSRPTEYPTMITTGPTNAPSTSPSISPSDAPTKSPTRNPTNVPTLDPTRDPTHDPTVDPTFDPTFDPTLDPTTDPTIHPTVDPTSDPTIDPTVDPTVDPTSDPTIDPTIDPTRDPTADPTSDPTVDPTFDPTTDPTIDPTSDPTWLPTIQPTLHPTLSPTSPTSHPTTDPTLGPTADPTADPTVDPTQDPTIDPTAQPTTHPTTSPTVSPSPYPTTDPTNIPTNDPTFQPTVSPTSDPTVDPTVDPTTDPTRDPTAVPTKYPTRSPTADPTTRAPSKTPSETPTAGPTLQTLSPSSAPTISPSLSPTFAPTFRPTNAPTTLSPTQAPTNSPIAAPTNAPTYSPSAAPTKSPTVAPSAAPSYSPSKAPTVSPTAAPSSAPSFSPSKAPTGSPTPAPTDAPTYSPTVAPTQPPTAAPSPAPTQPPTKAPSFSPTLNPTNAPTQPPTNAPSSSPTMPTVGPTNAPSYSPSLAPTSAPTDPTTQPTAAPTMTPTTAPTSAPTTYGGECYQSDTIFCYFMDISLGLYVQQAIGQNNTVLKVPFTQYVLNYDASDTDDSVFVLKWTPGDYACYTPQFRMRYSAIDYNAIRKQLSVTRDVANSSTEFETELHAVCWDSGSTPGACDQMSECFYLEQDLGIAVIESRETFTMNITQPAVVSAAACGSYHSDLALQYGIGDDISIYAEVTLFCNTSFDGPKGPPPFIAELKGPIYCNDSVNDSLTDFESHYYEVTFDSIQEEIVFSVHVTHLNSSLSIWMWDGEEYVEHQNLPTIYHNDVGDEKYIAVATLVMEYVTTANSLFIELKGEFASEYIVTQTCQPDRVYVSDEDSTDSDEAGIAASVTCDTYQNVVVFPLLIYTVVISILVLIWSSIHFDNHTKEKLKMKGEYTFAEVRSKSSQFNQFLYVFDVVAILFCLAVVIVIAVQRNSIFYIQAENVASLSIAFALVFMAALFGCALIVIKWRFIYTKLYYLIDHDEGNLHEHEFRGSVAMFSLFSASLQDGMICCIILFTFNQGIVCQSMWLLVMLIVFFSWMHFKLLRNLYLQNRQKLSVYIDKLKQGAAADDAPDPGVPEIPGQADPSIQPDVNVQVNDDDIITPGGVPNDGPRRDSVSLTGVEPSSTNQEISAGDGPALDTGRIIDDAINDFDNGANSAVVTVATPDIAPEDDVDILPGINTMEFPSSSDDDENNQNTVNENAAVVEPEDSFHELISSVSDADIQAAFGQSQRSSTSNSDVKLQIEPEKARPPVAELQSAAELVSITANAPAEADTHSPNRTHDETRSESEFEIVPCPAAVAAVMENILHESSSNNDDDNKYYKMVNNSTEIHNQLLKSDEESIAAAAAAGHQLSQSSISGFGSERMLIVHVQDRKDSSQDKDSEIEAERNENNVDMDKKVEAEEENVDGGDDARSSLNLQAELDANPAIERSTEQQTSNAQRSFSNVTYISEEVSCSQDHESEEKQGELVVEEHSVDGIDAVNSDVVFSATSESELRHSPRNSNLEQDVESRSTTTDIQIDEHDENISSSKRSSCTAATAASDGQKEIQDDDRALESWKWGSTLPEQLRQIADVIDDPPRTLTIEQCKEQLRKIADILENAKSEFETDNHDDDILSDAEFDGKVNAYHRSKREHEHGISQGDRRRLTEIFDEFAEMERVFNAFPDQFSQQYAAGWREKVIDFVKRHENMLKNKVMDPVAREYIQHEFEKSNGFYKALSMMEFNENLKI